MKPEGVLAVWTYGLARVSPEVDEIIDSFYSEIVGEYWPFERKMVETNYESIDFPFEEIAVPSFSIKLNYSLDDYLAYLFTWSAVKKYMKEKDANPIDLIEEEMTNNWGSRSEEKTVIWPVHMVARRKKI